MTVFDRPSASELLDAVIDFINAETKSEDYPANKRFKLQIVSNVLSIVKRELDLGKEINDDFSKLGADLIKDKDFSTDKLAEKIRNIEIIAWTTLIFGILLYISDKFKIEKTINKDFSLKSALLKK